MKQKKRQPERGCLCNVSEVKLLREILESRTEDEVTYVTGDSTFILTPEERPIIVVLEVIRMTEENARSVD